MRSLFVAARDSVRAQLWPIPTVALLVAVVAGSLLPRLDRAVDDDLPGWLAPIIFNGGPGAAQTVLDAVASSLITVTSLTFSLTVVTLQLASSQFSPRLLRTFSRDLFVQTTLALFLATFVYSLAVLRLVRSEDGENAAFVPRLSVTVAFFLAVASVFVLVLFLAHLTRTIRVEAMLANVHAEAVTTMGTTLDERDARTASTTLPTPPISGRVEVARSQESGFLVRVEESRLVRAATEADALVVVDALPGDFLVRGMPMARAWPAGADALTPDAADALLGAITSSVHTGFERTAGQDVAFGLRQITDVANKALSPGINDPTTAVHAIGHLASLLCDLADHDLGPRVLRDDDDVVRVVLSRPDFAALVEAAISQPRRYGAADSQVLAELFRLLDALAVRVPPDLHPVVRTHLERLDAVAAAQDLDDAERGLLSRLGQQVQEHLRDPQSHRGRVG